jgi:signal transduction histidine kinase
MLQSVLGNLLGNAAEYGSAGCTVTCKAEIEREALTIRVVNPVDDLESADVAHFFEPFWRKDAARSDGSHSGLGLALARAYAETLGGSASASLQDGDTLCVAVTIPLGGSEGDDSEDSSAPSSSDHLALA